MTPDVITAEFRTWLGVPWVHQGRTPHGVDCAGLIVCALQKLGLMPRDFPDLTTYGREPNPDMARLVERYGRRVETPAPYEGLLVLCRWRPSEVASHVAYCTGRNLIHAYSRALGPSSGPTRQAGRVVEHRYGEPWIRQTAGLFRIPGVEYSENYSPTVPDARRPAIR